MAPDTPPVLAYWRLYVDAEGVSRQKREEIRDFHRGSISPPAAPQWLGPTRKGGTTTTFTILPPGWVGDWHPNPAPQWIVPLSGRWYVESMDGTRVEMGPGEVSFGGDQDARERDGRKGHASGVLGDEPCVLMLVQYDNAPGGDGAPI